MSKLFIIDDDKSITSSYADFFVGKGYIVATSNTPFGVTNGIKLFLPDVVIVDMNISGLSGKGILNIIGDNRSFKVVLISEDKLADEMKALAEQGEADDYFVKGEPLLQLAVKVSRLIGRIDSDKPGSSPLTRNSAAP
jgi:two-component system, OmpR family, response regulator TctD